jgi:hypothetical protein
MQQAVSGALSHVDINVPRHHRGAGHSNGHPSANGDAGTAVVTGSDAGPANAEGPNTAGSAAFGLCTAAANHASVPGKSVAFSKLQAAAAKQSETVSEYCNAAVDHPGHPGGRSPTVPGSSSGSTTTTTPASSTTTPTTGASGGSHTNNGKSGVVHGPPTSTPGKGKGQGKAHTTTTTLPTTTTTTAPTHGKSGQPKKPAPTKSHKNGKA